MQWSKITDIILVTAFAVLAVFAILGFYQWIKRKSIKKVDQPLLAMLAPLSLMAIAYIIFDKFLVLNTRPNGSGEPSFPSTHTMVVATIFLLTALILPKYIKSYCLSHSYICDFLIISSLFTTLYTTKLLLITLFLK